MAKKSAESENEPVETVNDKVKAFIDSLVSNQSISADVAGIIKHAVDKASFE